MAQNNLKSVIEALLFASEKPLTIEQLRTALDNLGAQHIRGMLEELKGDYEQAARGMRVIEIAGGFQMVTWPGYAPFLKKIYKSRNAERLSKPALETLAIIAYKQPLTKTEIESLRNVNVDGVMSNLTEKGLIRITGRKKAPGRPFVFGTTRLFLEHFGLKSLEELPKMQDFSLLAQKAEAEAAQTPEAKNTEAVNELEESAQADR